MVGCPHGHRRRNPEVRPQPQVQPDDRRRAGRPARRAFLGAARNSAGSCARLEFAGELVEVKKRRLADPERVDLVVGTLLCNPRGFGFLRPVRERDGEDRYVSGENMSSAMHGDLVVARMPPSLRPRPREAGRRRGRSGGRGRGAVRAGDQGRLRAPPRADGDRGHAPPGRARARRHPRRSAPLPRRGRRAGRRGRRARGRQGRRPHHRLADAPHQPGGRNHRRVRPARPARGRASFGGPRVQPAHGFPARGRPRGRGAAAARRAFGPGRPAGPHRRDDLHH